MFGVRVRRLTYRVRARDHTPPKNAIDSETRYFTNTHLPVFAVINLPEIVKGATLCALQPDTPCRLRRLFLDEFYKNTDNGDSRPLPDYSQRKMVGSDECSSAKQARRRSCTIGFSLSSTVTIL